MPYYTVRHLTERVEELPCLVQIEDECAAMYFNIVHGAKHRRRFTTTRHGKPCVDYMLIARDIQPQGLAPEREVALFELI